MLRIFSGDHQIYHRVLSVEEKKFVHEQNRLNPTATSLYGVLSRLNCVSPYRFPMDITDLEGTLGTKVNGAWYPRGVLWGLYCDEKVEFSFYQEYHLNGWMWEDGHINHLEFRGDLTSGWGRIPAIQAEYRGYQLNILGLDL